MKQEVTKVVSHRKNGKNGRKCWCNHYPQPTLASHFNTFLYDPVLDIYNAVLEAKLFANDTLTCFQISKASGFKCNVTKPLNYIHVST